MTILISGTLHYKINISETPALPTVNAHSSSLLRSHWHKVQEECVAAAQRLKTYHF